MVRAAWRIPGSLVGVLLVAVLVASGCEAVGDEGTLGRPVLLGQVRTVEGVPVEGVRLILHGGFATRWSEGEVVTDSEGRYRVDPCELGSRVLNEESGVWDRYVGIVLEDSEWVAADGGWWWDVVVPGDGRNAAVHDVVVVEAGRLRCDVMDAEGARVAGAAVRVVGVAENPYFRWASADQDGVLSVAGLYPGAYQIEANEPSLRYPVLGRVVVEAAQEVRGVLLWPRVAEEQVSAP